MDRQEPNGDALDENYRDKLAAIGRATVSAIPLAGGVLAEIVSSVIPDQRADRIAIYLRALAVRVDQLESKTRESISANPEKVHLIEEGGLQSARATTQARIDCIVEAVTRGLRAEDTEVIRKKRLLYLFGELDEDEIALLNAYGKSYAGDDQRAFDEVDQPAPPHLQSSESEIAQRQLYELGQDHLVRLGLIKKNYGSLKKGAIPEFDPRKGDFKNRLEISYLGRMLLKEVGMALPLDVQRGNV